MAAPAVRRARTRNPAAPRRTRGPNLIDPLEPGSVQRAQSRRSTPPLIRQVQRTSRRDSLDVLMLMRSAEGDLIAYGSPRVRALVTDELLALVDSGHIPTHEYPVRTTPGAKRVCTLEEIGTDGDVIYRPGTGRVGYRLEDPDGKRAPDVERGVPDEDVSDAAADEDAPNVAADALAKSGEDLFDDILDVSAYFDDAPPTPAAVAQAARYHVVTANANPLGAFLAHCRTVRVTQILSSRP